MNFAIIRPAAPIRPAGQAAPGTSSNFVSFLILGGLAVGAYYWWTESAPAPRAVKSERKMSDAQFATEWSRIEREAKAEREAVQKSVKADGFPPHSVGQQAYTTKKNLLAALHAMQKIDPSAKLHFVDNNWVEIRGHFPESSFDRVTRAADRLRNVHLKEWDTTVLGFEMGW